MKLSRSRFIKASLFAGCFLSVARSAISAQITIKDSYDDLESLKKGTPSVSKWWTFVFREKLFVVCLQELPSYGQSRNNVHVWGKDARGSFVLVWSFRTLGIGSIEIDIEESKGTISVKAIDYTNLKDSIIAFVNLQASRG
jgi:hypothetical protein